MLEGEFVDRRELWFFWGEVGSFVNEAGGGRMVVIGTRGIDDGGRGRV